MSNTENTIENENPNSMSTSTPTNLQDPPCARGSVVIANRIDLSIQSDADNSPRTCWICFATEEDNTLAAWVQPCRCRGTTKWVHQSCLYRWIDEKQKGNALRPVTCQQCQTEYIIVFPRMGAVANALETVDHLVKRLSPFLAAGIFVGSIYWTAVTYGAVTFLQVNILYNMILLYDALKCQLIVIIILSCILMQIQRSK